MEKLLYINLNRRNRKRIKLVSEIFLALSMGFATLWCYISIFEIPFSLGNFSYIYNKIARALLLSDGYVIEQIGVPSENGIFLIIIGLFMSLLTWIILKSHNRKLLWIFPILILLPVLTTSLVPDLIAFMVFAGVLLNTYSYMKDSDGRIYLSKIGILAILILIVGLISSAPIMEKVMTAPKSVISVATKIEETLDIAKYGKSPLNDGNLSQDKRNVDQEEVALKITMNNPTSMYLRGFVGELYGDNKWESLPYESYEQSESLFFWLREYGFNGIGQIGQASQILGNENADTKVTVKVKNTSKKYAYIPYEINQIEGSNINWYDDYLTKSNTGRFSKYTFSSDGNKVKEWTTLAGEIFTSDKNQNLEDYLLYESYYNQFIYESYTYLSSSDKQLLKKYIGTEGNQDDGHIEYKTAIEKVKSFLYDNIVYTENPKLVDNKDKSINILSSFFEKKKGYDVQYATAATLMFRYYGIPARYVEGYLITPEDIANIDDGETIEITQKNVHAWTEIYVDGIGFVPIEVCPNYKNIMEETDMNIGISNSIANKRFEDKSNISYQVQKEVDTNKSQVLSSKLNVVLMIIIIIILIALLILFFIKIVKKIKIIINRNKILKKSSPKIAVAKIYEYMILLGLNMEKEEIHLGNKAAYSLEEISEEDRKFMLQRLKNLKCEERKQRRKSHGKHKKKSKK